MPQKKPGYKFEQFFASRRIAGFTPAPDGESVLFATDISGQFNLWRVAAVGGWPDQLTLFERESVRGAVLSEDGSRICFLADPDGNEQYQLYLMDAALGWAEQFTDQPDVQHIPGAFSPDGRLLAYSANSRNRTDVDVWVREVATGDVRMLCGGGGFFGFGRFSPDGRQAAVVQANSNTDQDIWLVDVATGERRNLTDHPGREVLNLPLFFGADGAGLYCLSNDGREFQGVCYLDLATGKPEWLLTPDWDVEFADLAADGRTLAYAVNEAGNSTLHLYDLKARKELAAPPLPRGVILGLEFGRRDPAKRLFLWMGNYRQAGAVYVLDLATGELRRLTQSMLGNIPEEVFVEPELVHITSFDGQQVPAWLYRPKGLQPGERVPAVLSIHGGPEAQERPGYNYGGFYQYLLHQGIAILAPNIRGSTGFGIAYQMQIHRDFGGDDLKDIEACAQYLQSLDWVDPARLGVWGGSYGGFATLSAVSRLPQYWAAGADLVGPANLITFVASVPPHWKPMMKGLVGDAEEDRAMLIERSPITYVDRIGAPLMVVQGANDPRVVKAESDQMVERLRSLGRTVEYLVFDDEGHGFAKRKNQLRGWGAIADFLIRHLTGNPTAAPETE